MSKFTNPAGRASGASAQYIRDLLELLGNQDPVAVQRGLVLAVGAIIEGLTTAQLTQPEAPGKWSMLQVLEHLTDQELVNSYRLRSVIAEDEPELRGYDQDRWAQRLHYGAVDASTLLEELAVLRRRNVRLLERLTPAELERVGRHAERGRESAARICALTAGHDLVHRQQLARIRAAVSHAPSTGGT
jgi:hypothetical protein